MLKLKILLGVLFLWNIGFAQERTVRDFPMEEKSLLWKIEGSNVSGEAYLFGTMHLIQKEYFHFPKKMEKLVRKSDLLVMELAGLPAPTEALKYVLLDEGSFFDYFNEVQTDSILIWAKEKLNFEEATFRASFSKMKPFTVVQLAIQMHFLGKTESYEMTFEEVAKENKIPIEGLETVEEQMSIFSDLSDEQQTQMVMESIREGDESIQTMEQMQSMYASQDIDSLFIYIQEEGGVLEEEQNRFLDDRNKKWIPKIVNYISTKNTFIAVGAGHLGGPSGLIRLLENEGYTLTPVHL